MWILVLPLATALASLPAHAAEPAAARDSTNPRGTIVFTAATAVIEGDAASVDRPTAESGVRFKAASTAQARWSYKPQRWGMYDIELILTPESQSAVDFTLRIGNRSLRAAGSAASRSGAPTERTLHAGRFYLPTSDAVEIRVGRTPGSTDDSTAAVRAVRWVPAPEGAPARPGNDGAIVLEARDALTHSVLMRYEPQPIKNCLGYWANADDWAEWTFDVGAPGEYDIELWQGCGKGHGGSRVRVEAGMSQLEFTVIETGHFQTFVPRLIGRTRFAAAGRHTLAVKPQQKPGGAVMDIRQVRLLPVGHGHPAPPALHQILTARRVAFVGDSITYAGDYIAYVETWLRLEAPDNRTEFLNLGLPSETVSGLSEPGHAGGSFPRPDLHERLTRLLQLAKPDLLIACYGMNDGIYHPPDPVRLERFQAGIAKLRQTAAGNGAAVIHVTPPVFDPFPLKGRTLPAGLAEYRQPFEGYNAVLDEFATWLVARRVEGWLVFDPHQPMNDFLAAQRAQRADFLLAGDGVHLNEQGHWLLAREILRGLGAESGLLEAATAERLLGSHPQGAEIFRLTKRRLDLLKDPWLTRVGHQRPGMNAGNPFDEATAAAATLDSDRRRLLAR